MKKVGIVFLVSVSAIMMFTTNNMDAQVPSCGPNVPFYQVNLTGQPAGSWISPGHSRDGNCCGTQSPDRCTSFEVILDTQAVMVNFTIASGAIPPGSMFYQINCGPQIPVGQPICVTGVGPHHITFCKPGNNQNTYRITSIPRPIFPRDDSVRVGCNQNLLLMGLDTNSVTWTSIYPGGPGQYNSFLSCTSNCTNPIYTPTVGAPPYVDYKICGLPTADECGYVFVCDTVRIYNIGSLSGSVTPNPATFCSGGPGVLLTAIGSGGDGNYSYVWRDQLSNIVGTNATYLASGTGTFSVEIRDGLSSSNTCPPYLISVPVTVTLPPIVNAGIDQTLCSTSPTAYLTGTVQYATGGIWSGGLGTYNPSNTSLFTSYTPTPAEISAGGVTLVLTSTGAGGGCVNTTDTIRINYPPVLTTTIPPQSLGCNNSTVTLSSNVGGGVFPYSYLWNNSATTSSIIVGQGNYCVTVTDMIGCTATFCRNVTAPSVLNLVMSSTDVTFPTGNDGTATATPSGGIAPYTYLWSNGQTAQTATGLVYGVYSVVITDANGCTISSSAVVNEPFCSSFQANATSTNILCWGASTGTATVIVTGGTSPYTYLWNPTSQTTPTASGLNAGTYLVIVTDANGCIDAVAAVVTQPAQLVNNMNHTNATTVGGNDGNATANPSEGTPFYSYLWSTGATTSSINNLTMGSYYLTITDANGCTKVDSVFINQPPCNNLALGIYFTPPNCFGGSNGTASAIAAFGTSPYSFSWSNSATTQSISNLTSGGYAVTVTDAVGCSQFQTITVTQPQLLSLVLSPTNVTCASLTNGTIELTVNGGTFPYSYNWSNSINVQDQFNLGTGIYSVVVTDANGCTASSNTSIFQPTPLNIGYTKVDVTCYGGNDGSVDVTISGGTIPYTYLWSNSATTQDIFGLTANQYFLTVTDANGCNNSVSPLSVLIDEPLEVSVLSAAISCPFPNSGVAYVVISAIGGNGGPYQVSYNNGSSYNPLGDYDEFLPVDSMYYIVVRDSNGCLSASDTISINPEVTASNISFATCFPSGTSVTSVLVNPVGGNGGPYQVSFDNGNSFNGLGNYSMNLPIDNSYGIVVQDSLGCVSDTFYITIPDTIDMTPTLSSYIGGNNVSCFGSMDGSVTLNVTGGTSPYTYLWSNSATTQNISNLPSGNYSVMITDVNGCTKTTSVTLTEPSVVIISATSTADTICVGTNITLSASASGGTPGYSYAWLPSGSGSSIIVNPSLTTIYVVTATDTNSCSATTTIAVVVNLLPVVSFNTNPNPASGCGSLCVDFINTTLGSTNCLWNFGVGTSTDCNPTFCFNTSGVYDVSLTITDTNGCVNSITFPSYVSVYPYPVASFSASSTATTLSNSNICFSDLSSGATQWLWGFGDAGNTTSTQQNPCFTYEDTGTYVVVLIVTTSYGCTDTAYVTIHIDKDPDELAMPTGYSPNGDGWNEFFVVKGLDRFPDNTFIVFNRWGNEVYSTKSYDNKWNGKNNNGEELPDGTYFVILSINGGDIKLSGYVDIRR